jgi:hypothetical protein
MMRAMRQLLAARTALAVLTTLGAIPWLGACRDLSRFSTADGDHFEGVVTRGTFVRAGIDEDVRMCLTLDTDHLQDAPGAVTTSDGRFRATPLRPIPQIWQDPLSTLTFGQGRIKNLVYALSPEPDAGDSQDVYAVVSLRQNDDVDVRLLRGAPGGTTTPMFGVFTMGRAQGPCSF